MESSTAPKMLQQAEKILLQPIRSHLMAYCPTMDLVAVVTEEENLDVYRINGQRAFGMRRKNPSSSIDYICWKFNGQSIALAWSDGLVDIISAETGKILQKDMPLPSKVPGSSRIRCIGWGVNFIDVDAVKARTGVPKKKNREGMNRLDFTATMTDDWDSMKHDTTLDDFLQRQPDLQALDMAPDLPNQLALMDMEALLPKLPALPLPPTTPFARAIQPDMGAFSSQAQVDAIFHSHHLKDHNAVDTLIRCTDDGTVNPTIYDSLRIVNVRLPSEWSIESYQPLVHASHPFSCSHGLLMEIDGRKSSSDTPSKPLEKTKRNVNLALVPLTLKFIPSAGIYLHLIASKTTQLQNLLLYIEQCLQRIRTFWNQSQDLPSKFIRNVTETLEERGQGDLVMNFYHLACTGSCPAIIKEWLVDELTESGHKRWDHAVINNLSNVISLLHENFLPALDRCSIVISRLRGLAKYDEALSIFNVPVQELNNILDVINCLRLLGHTVLLYAGDEKRQFAVFSKWLRYEIDLEGTTSGSQSREDMENRDPGIEYGPLLEYIQHSLTKSELTSFLRLEKDLPQEVKSAASIDYDETRKAIEWFKDGAEFHERALCLDHVNGRLGTLCGRLLQQFSSWQASSTSMKCGMVLEEGEVSEARDVRMVYEVRKPFSYLEDVGSGGKEKGKNDLGFDRLTLDETLDGTDDVTTYISVVMKEAMSQVHLHLITHEPILDSIPRSIHMAATTTLDYGLSATVLDLKFADDISLLVLLRATQTLSYILSIPYNPHHPQNSTSEFQDTDLNPLPYNPIPNPSFSTLALPTGRPTSLPFRGKVDMSTQEQLKPYVKHIFDTSSEDKFQPVKLVVNGRKGRRVLVVLGEDRRHYRVLDLDFKEAKGKKEDGGRGGMESEVTDESDIEMIDDTRT